MQGEAENKQNKKPAALAFGAVIFLLLGMIYIAINTGSLNVTMGELYRDCLWNTTRTLQRYGTCAFRGS